MAFSPIDALMEKAVREDIFPGAVLLVGKGGHPIFFEAYGVANRFDRTPMTLSTVFDLASLTKPLATTLAVARLVDQGKMALDQPVREILPEFGKSSAGQIMPRQLLCHQGGLPSHERFYMACKNLFPSMRKSMMLTLLTRTALVFSPGKDTLYSDLGFMLLCRLVEKLVDCSMDRFLEKEIYGPMGLNNLFFIDLLDGAASRNFPCAATELCPVRNRLLIREVHDDNAWFAGGVDGQAGLFGTAMAVFTLLQILMTNDSPPLFFSRQMREGMLYGDVGNRFTLGFDRPSKPVSSSGRYFSADTVGHLGFTGTSFWMDLEKSVIVILLTNRVHPFRWSSGLLAFRSVIHDAIMEHFGFQ